MSNLGQKRIIVAVATASLALLIWFVFSRLRLPEDQDARKPSREVAEREKEALPAITAETPPFIEGENGKVTVNVPLVGWVEGVKLPPTPMEHSLSGDTITPEILVTDSEGNFLYLRNQKPLHAGARSMETLKRSIAEKAAELSEMTGKFRPETKVLGPGDLKLANAEIFQAVANFAGQGDPSTWDIEVWGVRFDPSNHPGPRSGFLVSATRGRQRDGFIAVPSREGFTRKYTFYGEIVDGDGYSYMGEYEVQEKWIGEPPVSEEEHQAGMKAQENQGRRVFQD